MVRFLLATVVALLASRAHSMNIGVFADAAGTDCSLAVPYPGNPTHVFVVVTLDDIAPDGIALGSFRIVGMPEDWTTEVISTPGASVAIGDVLQRGGFLAYSVCMGSAPQVLMELAITPTSAAENVAITVDSNLDDDGNCFLNSCGPCPRFCGCAGVPACYCASTVV